VGKRWTTRGNAYRAVEAVLKPGDYIYLGRRKGIRKTATQQVLFVQSGSNVGKDAEFHPASFKKGKIQRQPRGKGNWAAIVVEE